MATKQFNINYILNMLNQHQENIKNFGVHSLALFGSTVRNQATETSDLDFLVEFEGITTIWI